jgi:hypothetical protein
MRGTPEHGGYKLPNAPKADPANDPRLFGMPDNMVAMFRDAVKDIEKYPRIGINMAVAHMQIGNFSSAGKLLCNAMDHKDNAIKLEAAATLLDMTVNRKAPTQGEHFEKAMTTLDAACERGSVKAVKIRHQLAAVNFDISLG